MGICPPKLMTRLSDMAAMALKYFGMRCRAARLAEEAWALHAQTAMGALMAGCGL